MGKEIKKEMVESIAARILGVMWETFDFEEDKGQRWDPEEKTFCSKEEPNIENIEEIDAILEKQVRESLEKHGIVSIYVCPDNGVIAFEDPEDVKEFLDKPEDPDHPYFSKLYINWD